MPYKVGLPKNKENLAENSESSSIGSLLNNTGNTGNSGNKPADQIGTGADSVDQIVEQGRIIAVEISSTVLEADIWFALADDFDPQDGKAVFYAHELEFLRTKTAEQLREIHKVKLSFGPGSRVRQ
jgi:hypothetical protein